jgi:hypothetical protein
MNLPTERIIEKYNTWSAKLENAIDRSSKKNAREMKEMFRIVLMQRNINLNYDPRIK